MIWYDMILFYLLLLLLFWFLSLLYHKGGFGRSFMSHQSGSWHWERNYEAEAAGKKADRLYFRWQFYFQFYLHWYLEFWNYSLFFFIALNSVLYCPYNYFYKYGLVIQKNFIRTSCMVLLFYTKCSSLFEKFAMILFY